MSGVTSHDKELFLETTKQTMTREHGIEWTDIEETFRMTLIQF